MAPLPSEAAPPTLTIDGVAVPLTLNGTGCGSDTGYSTCYGFTTPAPRTYGVWTVGDAASGNKARVLLNDVQQGGGAGGSKDNLKLTGVTFTPVVAAGTKTTTAFLSNGFTNSGGTSADYYWYMSVGGHFDPPNTENVVGDRMKLSGTAIFPGFARVDNNLGILNKGYLATPTTNNLVGYISDPPPTRSALLIKAACNTGSGKCTPTVEYIYEITIVGQDTLHLTDSVGGCGGTCDPLATKGSKRLPLCAALQESCKAEGAANSAKDIDAAVAAGGVQAKTCLGTCILITVRASKSNESQSLVATFNFTASGQDVSNFTITTDASGSGDFLFDNVTPDSDPVNVERLIDMPNPPTGWDADQISCISTLDNGTTTWDIESNRLGVKGPLHVLTLGATDLLVCEWHAHNGE